MNNGKFVLAMQRQYVQAQKDVHSLINKSRQLLLPIDITFQLFDYIVVPILLYVSQVWGMRIVTKKLHLELCRMVFRSTNYF